MLTFPGGLVRLPRRGQVCQPRASGRFTPFPVSHRSAPSLPNPADRIKNGSRSPCSDSCASHKARFRHHSVFPDSLYTVCSQSNTVCTRSVTEFPTQPTTTAETHQRLQTTATATTRKTTQPGSVSSVDRPRARTRRSARTFGCVARRDRSRPFPWTVSVHS